MRRMTRFSIRRLLLATAVVAVGMALIAKGTYVLLGCSIAGAGAAIPFSRTWAGVLFGAALGPTCIFLWAIGSALLWWNSPYNDWNY